MRIAQVSKTSETTPTLAPYLIILAQYNSLSSIDGGDSMFTMFTPYDNIWCCTDSGSGLKSVVIVGLCSADLQLPSNSVFILFFNLLSVMLCPFLIYCDVPVPANSR